MSAAQVLGKLSEVMQLVSTEDTTKWEPAETIAFANGVEVIHNIMQAAKTEVLSNAD